MVNDVMYLTHPGGISQFYSQLRLSAHYISLANVRSPEYCSMITVLVDLADSPDSSGGIVMSCGMDDLMFNSGQRQGIFHFSKMPRLCLGPQPILVSVTRVLFGGVGDKEVEVWI